MPIDCEVSYLGIARDCTGNIGGIKAFYAMFAGKVSDITISTDPETNCGTVTAMTLTPTTAPNFVRYTVVPESSFFETDEPTDRTTGYKGYNTTVTALIPKMSGPKNCEISKFDSDSALVLILDKNGKYWLIGWDDDDENRGMEKTDSTSGTGTAVTDFNGYTLNLIHYTDHRPYEVLADVAQELITTGTEVSGASIQLTGSVLKVESVDEPTVAATKKVATK